MTANQDNFYVNLYSSAEITSYRRAVKKPRVLAGITGSSGIVLDRELTIDPVGPALQHIPYLSCIFMYEAL